MIYIYWNQLWSAIMRFASSRQWQKYVKCLIYRVQPLIKSYWHSMHIHICIYIRMSLCTAQIDKINSAVNGFGIVSDSHPFSFMHTSMYNVHAVWMFEEIQFRNSSPKIKRNNDCSVITWNKVTRQFDSNSFYLKILKKTHTHDQPKPASE